ELGFDNPKQFGLKDPASATTLNEALIVTLLTDSFHRARIMQHFQDGMKKFEEPGNDHKAEFARLGSMLRDGKEFSGTELATTRQQQELIYAMRNPLLRHLISRLAHLQKRVQEFQALYIKNNGKSSAPFTSPDEVLSADLVKCLQKKLPKIFDTIHDE